MRIARFVLLFGLRVYQLALSPALAAAVGPAGRCRFTPTCSEYAREAVSRHGAVTGAWLATRRLCRCHPWGQWGADAPPPGPLPFKMPFAKWVKHKNCHGS